MLHEDQAELQDRSEAFAEYQIVDTGYQLQRESICEQCQEPLRSVQLRSNIPSPEVAVECWVVVF